MDYSLYLFLSIDSKSLSSDPESEKQIGSSNGVHGRSPLVVAMIPRSSVVSNVSENLKKKIGLAVKGLEISFILVYNSMVIPVFLFSSNFLLKW